LAADLHDAMVKLRVRDPEAFELVLALARRVADLDGA
jgi:hypothetical protein